MSRVVCECGESFAPFLINGTPRSNCPFCHRALTLGVDGKLMGTKEAPPPPSQSIWRHPPQSALLSLPQTALNPLPSTDLDAPSASDAPSPGQSTQVSRVIPPSRFITIATLDDSIAELRKFLDVARRSSPFPLACPGSSSCVVSKCPKAFRCNALPGKGTGRAFVVGWTLAGGGLMLGFLTLIFGLLTAQFGLPDSKLDEQAFLFVFTSVFLAAVIAYYISSFFSHLQQKYVRAYAAAAERTGLHFLPLSRLPKELGEEAFPMICPTPAAWGILRNEARCWVDVFAAGTSDGQELALAEYTIHFDPNDHTPFGGALKAMQTVVAHKTAWSRPEITQTYLIAFFPELLQRVPDFVVLPNVPGFDRNYMQGRFQLVELATGPTRNYLSALAGSSHPNLLGQEFLALLARFPGCSIQVVAGRLTVWNGLKSTQASRQLAELVSFASKLRQLLIQQAG